MGSPIQPADCQDPLTLEVWERDGATLVQEREDVI